MTIKEVINEFKRLFPVEFGGHSLILRYNNRMYRSGLVRHLKLTNKSVLELVCLAGEREITRSEGFTLAFWSAVPLMLAISFITSGLICQFSSVLRGVYVAIGSAIGIPSVICFVVGFTEIFPHGAGIAYVKDDWFGPCCCCSEVSGFYDDDVLPREEESFFFGADWILGQRPADGDNIIEEPEKSAWGD
jgi:hypothetical protein